jgi:hypothetical protein
MKNSNKALILWIPLAIVVSYMTYYIFNEFNSYNPGLVWIYIIPILLYFPGVTILLLLGIIEQKIRFEN